VSKANRNRQVAREKIAKARAAEARRAKQRRLVTGIGIAVVLAAIAVPLALKLTSAHSSPPPPHSNNPIYQAASTPVLKTAALSTLGKLQAAPPAGPMGYESVPVPLGPPLASIATVAPGMAVRGITCGSEQVLFHIHAHLTIFVNGSQRQVPAGVGIPGAQVRNTASGAAVAGGKCFYWLHTHAADGIIHIESPVHRTFTLGDFFDIWGLPLGPDQVGPDRGTVTVIYNGMAYVGNPRDIPLNAHAQIQLEVGTPLVAQQAISSWAGL
jgi:hypothetical protein